MKKCTLVITLFCTVLFSFGQIDFTVPDSVLADLHEKHFDVDSGFRIGYKMVYPKNYDPKKRYPVFLGLSGGGASAPIVDYCYYTVFNSSHLDDYIKVFPIAPKGQTLRNVSKKWISGLIGNLSKYELATENGWIVGGTSNGGVGAFNFALQHPKRFKGIITIPGALGTSKNQPLPPEWSNYQVLVCVGEKDDKAWLEGTKKTFEVLKTEVFKGRESLLAHMSLPGQGHIVAPGYNMNAIYEIFFQLKAPE